MKSKGDIYNIFTSKGNVLIQYVFTDRFGVDYVRVLTRPAVSNQDLNLLASKKELFIAGIFLDSELESRKLAFEENLEIPKDFRIPKYMRDKIIDNSNSHLGWDIINIKTLKRKRVNHLSPQELELSPYGVWSIDLLIDRLLSNWSLVTW